MHGVCRHEHDILSILLQLVNVFWPWLRVVSRGSDTACLSARSSLTGRRPPLGRSGLMLCQVWVGGDFGSSCGWRGMFEPVARQRGRFWFAIASFEQLVAISDVRRERNKYEAFLQRTSISFPWVHSFLGFLKENGVKVQPIPLQSN